MPVLNMWEEYHLTYNRPEFKTSFGKESDENEVISQLIKDGIKLMEAKYNPLTMLGIYCYGHKEQ